MLETLIINTHKKYSNIFYIQEIFCLTFSRWQNNIFTNKLDYFISKVLKIQHITLLLKTFKQNHFHFEITKEEYFLIKNLPAKIFIKKNNFSKFYKF